MKTVHTTVNVSFRDGRLDGRCIRCGVPLDAVYRKAGHIVVIDGDRNAYGDERVRCDPSLGAVYEVMLT